MIGQRRGAQYLLAVVKVFHGDSAFNGAQGIASAIWIASYASCLEFQGGLPGLFWLTRPDTACQTRIPSDIEQHNVEVWP